MGYLETINTDCEKTRAKSSTPACHRRLLRLIARPVGAFAQYQLKPRAMVRVKCQQLLQQRQKQEQKGKEKKSKNSQTPYSDPAGMMCCLSIAKPVIARFVNAYRSFSMLVVERLRFVVAVFSVVSGVGIAAC